MFGDNNKVKKIDDNIIIFNDIVKTIIMSSFLINKTTSSISYLPIIFNSN